jgi:low temperature requirement protein LtrA
MRPTVRSAFTIIPGDADRPASLHLVHRTLAGFLVLVEFCGPLLAERHGGTPWHRHHIVERHNLFVLIALGEAVVGVAAALSAVVGQHGWTLDSALLGIAGTGLTFGMWWLYDLLPSARALPEHRHRAAAWGFGQTWPAVWSSSCLHRLSRWSGTRCWVTATTRRPSP